MNLVYENPSVPLRVLVINPTQDVAVMLCIKALRGLLFGPTQLIDLILLVYENDREKAQALKWHLEAAAFPCNNSITVMSDIPRITDADVFIFISNFANPNNFDINSFDDDTHFDCLYLFLKIANNLEMPPPPDDTRESDEEKFKPFREAQALINKSIRRPIIVGDGVLTIDIIKTFSRNLPNDIFFSPTSMASLSKSILGDYLKVTVDEINYVYVWAANDNVFHIEVQPPIYLKEQSSRRGVCEWDIMGARDYAALNLDFTQFNETWLRKDFIEKILARSSCHPHGDIYKSAKISDAIKNIWKTRSLDPDPENKCNMGVISDGTIGTIKGVPYFLPVIFTGDTFKPSEYLKDDVYIKQEIKRINKVAWDNHIRLKNYCKKFLLKNVLGKGFVMSGEERSGSASESTAAGPSDIGAVFFKSPRDED